MIKFIDANIFIERWNSEKVRYFLDNLNREEHCTSVLVLSEVFHKLTAKKVQAFPYLRSIMGAIKVHNIEQSDLFTAMAMNIAININDRIHIAVMRRNNITTIISFDKDFDQDKTIQREEI